MLLLFIISPCLSLPFIFLLIRNNVKYAFTLLSIFMGLMALLYPPVGDIYRYTQDYYSWADMNWGDFVSSLEFRFDYLLPFLSFACAKLGLHFEIVRFLYVFVSYQIIFYIFTDIVSKNPYLRDSRIYIKCFILFTFCFSFHFFIFRFNFSLILMSLAFYRYFYCFKKDGFSFALLSCFNHFSFVLFLLLWIPISLGLFKFNKWFLWLCVILFFVMDSSFLSFIIPNMPISGDLVNHIMYYIDGKFAGEYLEEHSFKYKIALFLSTCIIYPILLFFLSNYQKSKQNSLVSMMLFILAIAAPFVVVAQRMSYFAIFLYLIYFLSFYNNSRKQRRQLQILLSFVLFTFVIAQYAKKREYSISQEARILYMPLPIILQSTYSESWINQNLGNEGEPLNAN